MAPRRLLIATVLTFAAATTPAAAQDPVPTPTPTPPPAPAPPATAALTLSSPTVGNADHKMVALQGDKLTITGALTPYVAGQKVVARLRQHGKTVGRKVVKVGPTGYVARLRLKRAGYTNVQAFHKPTPQLAATAAPQNAISVYAPALGYGSRGPLVSLFQRRLRGLRYAVKVTGTFDDRTSRGVIAWRKISGIARVGSADSAVIHRVLAKKGAWKVRHPKGGRHVEADLSMGVLSLVDGDRVVRTFHSSPGKPSTPTILGTFRFYLKTIGTNNVGMVDSNYFIRGYAIHGYHDVPVFNASHGCLRIPIPDARYVYDWIRIGDKIFVEP